MSPVFTLYLNDGEVLLSYADVASVKKLDRPAGRGPLGAPYKAVIVSVSKNGQVLTYEAPCADDDVLDATISEISSGWDTWIMKSHNLKQEEE